METPEWKTGDTLRSIADAGVLLLGAAKLAVAGAANKIDEWLCDYGDE